MTEPRHNVPDSAVVALPFGPTSASVQIVGHDCVLMGWAGIENTGAATAAFDLVDGGDDGGGLLLPVALSAGQSRQDTNSSWGVAVQQGLRVKVNSGTVRGVVYVVLP